MTSRLPDALDSFGPARFVVRNQRLAVVDSHWEIKNHVLSEGVATFSGKITFVDIESVMAC